MALRTSTANESLIKLEIPIEMWWRLFRLQDYVNAANCYEQLALLSTDDKTANQYRLHYANSLYQASLYDEAYKVTLQMDDLADFKVR